VIWYILTNKLNANFIQFLRNCLAYCQRPESFLAFCNLRQYAAAA